MQEFDLKHFAIFLKENNILTLTMAAILSYRINDLLTAIFDSLIVPLMEIDTDKNGKGDGYEYIKKIKDKKVNLGGVRIGTGELFLSTIQFIISVFLLFVITKYLVQNL